MLGLGNAGLQGVDVGSDFGSYRSPVSSGCVAGGLDFLFYLFGCILGGGPCLLFACLDFIMRLLLGSGDCVFGILGTNGPIRELWGVSLSYVFSPSCLGATWRLGIGLVVRALRGEQNRAEGLGPRGARLRVSSGTQRRPRRSRSWAFRPDWPRR